MKKHFDETVYTFDAHQKAKFKTALARMGINESNYIFLTINCPKRIDIREKKKQYNYVVRILKSLNIFYVACCEWSDERANGYHLHIIISIKDLNFELFPDELFIDDLFHKSDLLVNNCLDRCLGYLCKERKGCTAQNRKEKFYFNNIPERKLVPIGIRQIIKGETPDQAIEARSEKAVNNSQTKPKNKILVFFKNKITKVKSLFSRLFIEKKIQFKYEYTEKNLRQNTRDGPVV